MKIPSDVDKVIKSMKLPFALVKLQKEDALEACESGRFGLFYAVGGGKTVVSTVTAKLWEDDHTIVVCPPILLPQWEEWLHSCQERDTSVFSGPKRTTDMLNHRWVIMSHAIFRDSFADILHHFKKKTVNVLLDECFVAGTKITTPEGEVAIEDIKIGHSVMASDGQRFVSHVFKSHSFDIYDLEFSDGTTISCTGTHPIFSESGWVSARDFKGRRALHNPEMRVLQNNGISEERIASYVSCEKQDGDRLNLFEILRDETESRTASRNLDREWAEAVRESCDWQTCCRNNTQTPIGGTQSAGIKDAQSNEASADSAEGQWNRTDPYGSVDNGKHAELRIQMEPCSFPGKSGRRLPDELQAGLCTSEDQGGCGGGRGFAQSYGEAEAGQKERRQAPGAWVECISVIRRKDSADVWNLEVAGCPHYFANGMLVHNCQAIKNPKSKLYKCITQFVSPDRNMLMLTATPTSKPQDTYTYMKLKTPELYRSFGHWTNIHVDKVDIFGAVTAYKNLDLLADNFSTRAVSRTKRDLFGDNLDPIFQPIQYALAPAHLKLYQKLAEEQLLLLDNGEKIDATSAQRLRHALQQIVLNYGRFSGKETDLASGFDILDQIIEQVDPMNKANSKLAVWTYYKNSSRLVTAYLQEKFGKQAVVAAYSEVDSAKSVKAIMGDPECRILVAQPSSVGVGLNLHHVCSEMLFLEQATTPMQTRQAIGRVDRAGQKIRPTIRFAQAQGTIQIAMFNDLLRNDDLVSQVERTPKSLREEIFGS